MTETGAVARVTREELTVLSLDAPLDLEQVQQAWPRFEASLDSLQGRRMMGLVFNRQGVYRLATSKLERDRDHSYGLDETVVPGGDYLRLTLVGTSPELYSRIGAAFDALFEQADHDPDRPLIEFDRREGEVDCLVPVSSAPS
jgi:hypothetical protein